MLKPTRIAALFVLVAAVYLSGACIARAPEDMSGPVGEPITAGPCATACNLVVLGECDWESQCDEDYGGAGMGRREALCGPKFLSCDAAETASLGKPWATSCCWRSCEGLH